MAKELTKVLLIKAKSAPFRKHVESQCMKQSNGDYMVSINSLLSNDGGLFFDSKEQEGIKNLLKPYDGIDNGEWFSIYIPRLEKTDKRYPVPTPKDLWSTSSLEISLQDEQNQGEPGSPVGVIIDEVYEPDENNPLAYSYPGYVVDPYNNIYYFQYITEAYSWHNDVWIFGFQEILDPEAERIADLDLADPTSGIELNRVPGEMERAGFIKVLNGKLGNIRVWVKGKLSMRIVIVNGFGVIIADKKFGKLRRWRFMSEKWVEYDFEVGAWNLNNWGNYTVEKWIDVRSGTNQSHTISQPSQNGMPGFSSTFSMTKNSNDLGTGMVQFSDPKSTIYNNISFINFRRK